MLATSDDRVERLSVPDDDGKPMNLHLSTKGRYHIMQFSYGRFMIYDRICKTQARLFPEEAVTYDAIFRSGPNDSVLIAACSYTDAVGQESSTLNVWSILESQVKLQTTYLRDRLISALQLEDSDNVLHIVSSGIWSRLRLSGFQLLELDLALTTQTNRRVKYEVSWDGTRLALLHIGDLRYAVYSQSRN